MIIIIGFQASACRSPKLRFIRTVKMSWQRLPDSTVSGALTSFIERCHEGSRQAANIEDPEINMLMPGIRSQPGCFFSGEIDAALPAGKGALAAVRTADRGRRRPVSGKPGSEKKPANARYRARCAMLHWTDLNPVPIWMRKLDSLPRESDVECEEEPPC
jgi:hypothetical protein